MCTLEQELPLPSNLSEADGRGVIEDRSLSSLPGRLTPTVSLPYSCAAGPGTAKQLEGKALSTFRSAKAGQHRVECTSTFSHENKP